MAEVDVDACPWRNVPSLRLSACVGRLTPCSCFGAFVNNCFIQGKTVMFPQAGARNYEGFTPQQQRRKTSDLSQAEPEGMMPTCQQ